MGRENTDKICQNCYNSCIDCDVGATGKYKDCLKCQQRTGTDANAMYGIPFLTRSNKTYVTCAEYCPTNFDAADPETTCVLGANGSVIVDATFKYLDGPWATTNGATVTEHGNLPAKDRGQYFNNSEASHMEISAFKMHVHFTVAMWVRPDAVTGSTQTLFNKYDASFKSGLRIYINTTEQFEVEVGNSDRSLTEK